MCIAHPGTVLRVEAVWPRTRQRMSEKYPDNLNPTGQEAGENNLLLGMKYQWDKRPLIGVSEPDCSVNRRR